MDVAFAKSMRKMVLIDDDPMFRRLMSTYANSMGINLKCFSSLLDMHSFAHLKNYDLALIDFHLDSLSGTEIAEYVDIFFGDLPVIIVSGDPEIGEKLKVNKGPACIREFVSKHVGPRAILEAASKSLQTFDFYKSLKERSASIT